MQIEFDADRHAYKIDGVAVPGVTAVLDSQNRWDHIPAWILESARAVGRDVHEAVNLLAREELVWQTLEPAIAPYVRGAQRFLQTFGGVVIASEQRIASKWLGVAGTLDILIYKEGWEYLVDWKVSETVPSTVGAQLAAYQQLYADTFRGGKRMVRAKRLCVRLRKDSYALEPMNELNGDWNLFISCLNAYKHRERRSYA
jgi:hypothetical protein